MAKQAALFADDKADPQIAKIADRYVDLKKQKESVSESLEAAAKEPIRQLKKVNKLRVPHGDIIVELTHKAESESIKIKKAKQPKVTKVAGTIQTPVK